MITDLVNYFKDKKILILGFGREGQSTYKLIRKYLPKQELYISDIKENFQDNFDFFKEDSNVSFTSGEKYLENLNDYNEELNNFEKHNLLKNIYNELFKTLDEHGVKNIREEIIKLGGKFYFSHTFINSINKYNFIEAKIENNERNRKKGSPL